jgi:hypothetical protein
MNLPNYVIGSQINSTAFDWNPKSCEFVADIAELQYQGLDPAGRLYADSADLGFVMISAKTGETIEFMLHETQRNDGDVVYWEFKPTWADVFYNPKLRDVRAVVFND